MTSNTTRVSVPINVLVELMTRESKLNMLEAGGVDNWDGYSDSMYDPERGTDWDHGVMSHYFREIVTSSPDVYPVVQG